MVKKKIKASDILGDSYYIYELTSSNYTPALNDTIIIACTMKDVYGTVAGSKSITLYQNGINKGAKTTNSTGIAAWSITCSTAGIQSFKVGSKTIEVFVDSKVDNDFNVDYVHSFVYNSNIEKYGYAMENGALGIGISAIDINDNSILNENDVAIIDLVFQNTQTSSEGIQLVLAEANGRKYMDSSNLPNIQTIATISDMNKHHITIVVEQGYDYHDLKVSNISYDGSNITILDETISMKEVGVYLVFYGSAIVGNIEYMNVVKRTPIVNQIIDTIYPIGSTYISVNSVNPSFLFGGTWEQIQDKFLLASGTTYANGSTGGSADAIVVSHNHTQKGHNHDLGGGNLKVPRFENDNWAYTSKREMNYKSGNHYYPYSTTNNGGIAEIADTRNATPTINNTGSSGTGKNMPPYLAVYMWKRTA